jgi:glycosyltransferase involved in cell wall biosynthesis
MEAFVMLEDRLRVLHVVGRMHRAGVETWLMQILRRVDQARYQFDFLVQSAIPGDYDDEILSLGGRILYCEGVSNPWKYAVNFLKVVEKNGPYDAIHSHVFLYSGYVIWLAALSGIPRRVAHSHSTCDGKANTLSRHMYRYMMQRLINRYATIGLGTSRDACKALFGPSWEKDPRYRVLYCGIDVQSFINLPRPEVVRRLLGIPENASVVGHVGRFAPMKNHAFLLEIAAQALAQRADIWVLLVGDGPLRSEMEQRARDLGIAQRVVFTGVREAAPSLMAAMDVFLFPSLWEGLGIVLVEAQAAGVPCVVSDVVPEEASIVPGAIRRLPLESGVQEWTHAVLSSLDRGTVGRESWLQMVTESPFNLDRTFQELMNVYCAVR